jgi:hypothetical protein
MQHISQSYLALYTLNLCVKVNITNTCNLEVLPISNLHMHCRAFVVSEDGSVRRYMMCSTGVNNPCARPEAFWNLQPGL